MASQADTLKVAEADMLTARQRISDARRGRVFGAPEPKVRVGVAIRMMEHTARRLRKSFGLEGEVA